VIKGVGIDLVENKRIKRLYDTYGLKFANKILGATELNEFNKSNDKTGYLSKHFASKEALSKAIGIGLYREGLSPKLIEITHNDNGKPYFKESIVLQNVMKKYLVNSFSLSISDTSDYSTAVVISE